MRQNGNAAYSLLFAYAASHSLLLALFAGYAAHSGALGFSSLVLVCWSGSFAAMWSGSGSGGVLASAGSDASMARTCPPGNGPSDQSSFCLDDPDHRYPHGIRGVAGFAYGMSQLPWSTFLALNFVAAGLWSCTVVSIGYAFGQASEKLMSDASSGLGLVMLVAFLGLSWALSKKLESIVGRVSAREPRESNSWRPPSTLPFAADDAVAGLSG
jgi:hypothetical protein